MEVTSDIGTRFRATFAAYLTGRPGNELGRLIEHGTIDVSRHLEVGDFVISPSVSTSPLELDDVADQLGRAPTIERISRKGHQLYVTLVPHALFNFACSTILHEGGSFATGTSERGHKWMVYYGNPNLNKPLHVGHMRNLCIGETISRMLEAVGAEVIRGSIESDCGIHIAKTVFAKNHLASSAQESPAKGDHGAGQYYRLFEEALEQETTGRTSTVSDQEKSSLLEACEEMTVRWLRGDPETREAFRTITDAVAQGHRQTLDQVGVQFDRRFLESAAVNRIHEMVEKGLSLGVFRKNSQGAIVADLKAFNNTEPMIVRPNGIPVHLGIIAAHNAVVAEEYALHGTIGLEGSEFGDFLQVLTWVIGLLGYQPMDGSVLVNYGMVTRGGEDVSSSKADAPLIDDVLQRIGKELSSRLPGREAHLALGPNGATRLALANLKFFLLLIALHRNMAYDEKRLLQIRGKCGVSLLRGAARLSEFEECPGACAGAGLNLTRSQRILLLDMFRSPLALDEAITKIQPHRLAQSAYDLVRHAEVALDEGDRLADKNKALVRTMFAACLVILRRYLWLLNIAEVDSALSEVDSS